MSTIKDIDIEMTKIDRLEGRIPDRDGHNISDVISYVGDLFGRLGSDISNLISLRADLLKAELRDGAKTLAIDSALLIAGAFLGIFAFSAITLAIIGFIANALPLEGFMAFAVSAIIVGVAYAIIAGILVFAGIRHLQKRGVAPQRSIAEVKRDKEWVRDIKNAKA